MIARITRPTAPFYIQFELTERCNNQCYFCYNPMAHIDGNELTSSKIGDILSQLKELCVFRVNFNGGEPLMRDDLEDIMHMAYSLGFELHMNTNATLISNKEAEMISRYMNSVCTSILHSNIKIHDRMTGRTGSFKDVIKGIESLRSNNVKVEVNVCTSTENYLDMYNIGKLISTLDCYALCSTRYILNDKRNIHLLLDSAKTMKLIDILLQVKSDFPNITDVSLPGPVPYCEIDEDYWGKLRLLNIPCQYGYGLARISPTGKVTPCTISDDIIGDLNKETFSEIWNSNRWDKYTHLCHIPPSCRDCDEVKRCKGGCVVYDESIIACGEFIGTLKWGHTSAKSR